MSSNFKILVVSVFIISGLTMFYTVTSAQANIEKSDSNFVDTADERKIEAVVKAPAPPIKEDVQYVSRVTKYGFKNLFKNYTYNPTMPYSSQVNPYAENYMQDYLKVHGKYLQNLKRNSLSYFNYIDGILSQYGLPKELKYLAVIESDLKSNALSVAGARGPWQFMDYTAREYGLKVNRYVDDRTDYYKSTNAAAKYLLSLYKDLKDWLLVIAAYNGGPGRVYTAIKKSGSRNFWSLQYYLPEESRNHVKKFIATHYMMESNSADMGVQGTFTAQAVGDNQFPGISQVEDSTSGSIKVEGRYISTVIANKIDMQLGEFNRYNPGFDNILATGSAYNMRLPNEKVVLFNSTRSDILNACVEKLLNEVR